MTMEDFRARQEDYRYRMLCLAYRLHTLDMRKRALRERQDDLVLARLFPCTKKEA